MDASKNSSKNNKKGATNVLVLNSKYKVIRATQGILLPF
jgi:hypothetical protein